MKEKSLSNQESLELITRMIRNSQEKFERGAGKPFLIWGYTTIAVSLIVWWLLKTTLNPYWNWCWFAIPIIGTTLMLITQRNHPKKVTTFIDQAIQHVWAILGTCCILVPLYVAFFDKNLPVLFIISLLMFASQAITGAIIRLGYIRFMGLSGILMSFGVLSLNGIYQIWGFIAMFLIVMIIPGHIMNAQAKRHQKTERHDI